MQIHILRFCIHNASGNVGAVIGYSLHIRDEVTPYKARFDGAFALLKTDDVVALKLTL